MSQPQVHKNFQSGFTVMEMLITLTVVGVLVSVALPNMSEFSAKHKMIGAAEQLYGHLQQARSEAISSSTNTYTSFSVDGSTTWTYGISTNPGCDLTVTDATAMNACIIVVDDADADGVDPGDGSVDVEDLVLMRFTDADYDNIEMSIAMAFPTEIEFDSIRGIAIAEGEIDLTNSNNDDLVLRIKVGKLGRVSICSPDNSVIQNYGDC